jgi:tRNA(Leu) C34 or U34 (ribose-2'-O)-methylase TrmL
MVPSGEACQNDNAFLAQFNKRPLDRSIESQVCRAGRTVRQSQRNCGFRLDLALFSPLGFPASTGRHKRAAIGQHEGIASLKAHLEFDHLCMADTSGSAREETYHLSAGQQAPSACRRASS